MDLFPLIVYYSYIFKVSMVCFQVEISLTPILHEVLHFLFAAIPHIVLSPNDFKVSLESTRIIITDNSKFSSRCSQCIFIAQWFLCS